MFENSPIYLSDLKDESLNDPSKAFRLFLIKMYAQTLNIAVNNGVMSAETADEKFLAYLQQAGVQISSLEELNESATLGDS